MAENKAAVLEKITITGNLILKSPLRIGSGEEGEKEADIYVLKNRASAPIIPGTSLAGALRANFKGHKLENIIFGSKHDKDIDTNMRQSAIDIDDIILINNWKIIVRDGVAIDVKTGISKDGSKYNYEAVNKGANGDLKFVITIRQEQKNLKEEIEKFARDLTSLLTTGIRLGSLTSKGFGLVQLQKAKINFYDFSSKTAVKAWLLKESCAEEIINDQNSNLNKEIFIADILLSMDSSLIIRQSLNEKEGDMPIKAEQMKSFDGEYFILPGTSIKGVLRHQAQKIISQISRDNYLTNKILLDDLMGSADKKIKSRFIVSETYIKEKDGVHTFAQARNSIDYFTGGAMRGKLFGEKPLYQNKPDTATIRIHFEIKPNNDKKQRKWDLGLAMFLIKDLCLGNIYIGGEKSIGRGRLKGISVAINYNDNNYNIDGNGKLSGENANAQAIYFENFVKSFLAGKEDQYDE